MAEIQAKLRPGYRPVLDRAAALARFEELPGIAWLRSDSYATRWAVWQALLDFVHEDTGIAVVDQDRLGQRAAHYRGRPVPRTTAGDHLRALADEYAIYVEPGASKEILGTDRNRASVYVVIAPDVEESVDQDDVDVPLTPEDLATAERLDAQLDELIGQSLGTKLGTSPLGSAHTRIEDFTHPRKTAHFPHVADDSAGVTPAVPPKTVLGGSLSERPNPARREYPERYAARTRSEREIAVAWIAAVMGWTDRSRFAARYYRELRKITGPSFAAGWSPAAVVKAFHIQPDGTPWPGPLPIPNQRDSRDQPRIRNLWAILTYRLAVWRDPLGFPLDPPIPTERPRRGRPRKPPLPQPVPPPPARSSQAEAQLAAFRASNDQQRAELAAAEAERQARQRQLWDSKAGHVGTEIYLRARIERRGRR